MVTWGEMLRSPVFRRTVAVALLAVAVAACIGDSSTCAGGTASPGCKARSGANASEITGTAPARAAGSHRQVSVGSPPVLRKPQTVTAVATEPAHKPAVAGRTSAAGGHITGLIKRTHAPHTRPAQAGGLSVVVGRGETIDSLARRHGVAAAAIRQANQLPDRASVWSGQRLVIPRGA